MQIQAQTQAQIKVKRERERKHFENVCASRMFQDNSTFNHLHNSGIPPAILGTG